ncbi:MAG: S-layer homology domain-containing protein [Bryobacterales bacterium]|nr:S-layer homology domain-containing protein [Bryobacterales bacterium]
MRLFCCFMLTVSLWAEVTSGVSVRASTFDPATTPRGTVVAGKTKAPVHRSLLTPEQQAAQEAFVKPRSPERTPAPPRLESSIDAQPARAPALGGSPLADAASISFEGIAQTELLPPSPSIAVGPDDVIEVVNSRIARFSRDGKMTDSVHLQQWFQSDMPALCPSSSQGACILGDVSVRYDQYHGRFVMILQARDELADNSFILVSVSNGATYASGWKNWVLEAMDVNGPVRSYADFPQVGLDDQAIYITMVRFRSFFNSLLTPKVRILLKADLYKAGATALPYKDLTGFTNADSSQVLTLQPVHMRGRTGVAGPGALLINASGMAGADYLTMWRINNPGNPSAARTTLSGLWKYGAPAPAAQLGTITLLFTGTDPDVLKAVYREGVLTAAQNVGFADEPTTVAYTRINVASNSVLSQARWTNGNFFFPAFDVPATTGPAVTLPNKLITGTTTGADGKLTYGGITDVKAGEDVYRPSGDGQARYGEYFGGAVDPVNGGMWVTGEYAKPRLSGVSQYGTWVSYFPWGTTPLYSDVSTASPFFDAVNVLGLWGITGGCGAGIFCPGSQTTRSQMAAFVVRSIHGEKFTPPSTPYFTDVPATHPQFAYIQKLRELGITQGCTATKFCPDDTVTRSQAAVFVIRAKFGALFGDNFTFPSTAYFSDVGTGDPRFPFVQKLRELGVTQGCASGRFCPEDPVTREQMAVFLVRAFLN